MMIVVHYNGTVQPFSISPTLAICLSVMTALAIIVLVVLEHFVGSIESSFDKLA